MSSGSSNRYQSKLFNFVYQHTRRLTQTLENTFKNLQVATQVGVGSLLYPLYQLLQQNETAKQLQSATPPPSDEPIQNILDIVKNLPPGEADIPTSAKTTPFTFLGSLWEKVFPKQNSQAPENTLQQHIPTVQGIATELQTRNLVLVSADNRIFDVFTPQQNTKLADRINSEISEYRYSLQLIGHQQKELLPEIDRLLNKLTDEDSTIARKSLLNPIKLFGFLDKLVANLETTALVPVQQRSQEIVNNFSKPFSDLTVNNDNIESHKTNIADLIAAAINYFFGGRNNYQIGSNSAAEKLPEKSDYQKSFAPNQLNINDSLGDTWLTWNDLFGETDINIDEEIVEKSVNNDATRLQGTQWGLPSDRSKRGQNPRQPKNQEFNSQTSQGFDFKPDWIDISATSLGYEKHPLEQILEWLDTTILWIEQIFTNMLYFFRGLLFGR
ncbi:hypothetical protein FJR38_18370 [Anabaena sp. UHCC 0253]|uniref:hypothetical protein n=1 Tax=Anabaena sp. UHCC 0253 TaxID=2590019 RepID=UPI0014465879|nr:hypothetical protein [Anabaena sp. UHCC 0253]MTJ54480.1 hypothetical protein [Anabaena sp. UHCC 0253]